MHDSLPSYFQRVLFMIMECYYANWNLNQTKLSNFAFLLVILTNRMHLTCWNSTWVRSSWFYWWKGHHTTFVALLWKRIPLLHSKKHPSGSAVSWGLLTLCYVMVHNHSFGFSGTSVFSTNLVSTVWKALNRCWDEKVFIKPLFSRFWKLFLQVWR